MLRGVARSALALLLLMLVLALLCCPSAHAASITAKR